MEGSTSRSKLCFSVLHYDDGRPVGIQVQRMNEISCGLIVNFCMDNSKPFVTETVTNNACVLTSVPFGIIDCLNLIDHMISLP